MSFENVDPEAILPHSKISAKTVLKELCGQFWGLIMDLKLRSLQTLISKETLLQESMSMSEISMFV